MREIKRKVGYVTSIQTIDNNKLIKLEMISEEPDNEYHFIANYEYNDDGLLSHYHDNENKSIMYEYDGNERVTWKRKNEKNRHHIFHYFYKKDTEEIIKAEHLINNNDFIVSEFNNNEDKSVNVVVIEYNNPINITDIHNYCKENGIGFNTENNPITGNIKFITRLTNEEDLDEFKFLLELDNVKGVD